MKKSALLFAALLFAAMSGYVGAADVCNAGCAPAAHTCDASSGVVSGGTVTVPGPEGSTVTYGVPTPGPGQKLEWVEESYKDLEPRVETVQEVRTRMTPKKYNVVKTKTVTDTKIIKVKSRSGRQPRLARTKSLREKEYLKKETIMEEEEYLHPVQQTVLYEVDKIRRIPALVEKKNDKCD